MIQRTTEIQTFSPPEVAKRWNCTPEAVLQLLKSGALVGFKISPPSSRRPRWKVTLDALLAYENGETAAAPAKTNSKAPKKRPTVVTGPYY